MAESKKDAHYLSAKELREIARENNRQIKRLEKYKKRKASCEEFTTRMQDENNIVEFDDLKTYFFSDAGVVKAVDGVSFSIPRGSIVGVVGESGCGKSVTSLSLMRLVQAPHGQIVSGSIRFATQDYERDEKGKVIPVYETEVIDGEDKIKYEKKTVKGKEVDVPVQKIDEKGRPVFKLKDVVYDIAKMPDRELGRIRGREIAMIFQEPMTSLNPVFTIGNQLDEMIMLHTPDCTKQYAKGRSIKMLEMVGIAMPEDVYKRYPHELSGGMRQRVMIAISLSCSPKLIIADEPTTALDVTIQAQILDLLRNIRKDIDGSIMLITHDLGVIAETADLVVVMYAGRVIESGTVDEIFDNPLHPYTIGLQKSKPVINRKCDRLYSIPGQVPNPVDMPDYCYFRDRCNRCTEKCGSGYPQTVQVTPTHSVACYLYENAEVNNAEKQK